MLLIFSLSLCVCVCLSVYTEQQLLSVAIHLIITGADVTENMITVLSRASVDTLARARYCTLERRKGDWLGSIIFVLLYV
jgi:hypothetical protein